jgi:hypothetical protein
LVDELELTKVPLPALGAVKPLSDSISSNLVNPVGSVNNVPPIVINAPVEVPAKLLCPVIPDEVADS